MTHTTIPFLITGMQRSGTTILAKLLRQHPDVYLTIDGKVLYYLIIWILRDPAGLNALHPRLDEVSHGLLRKHVKGIDGSDLRRIAADLITAKIPIEGRSEAAYVRRVVSLCYERVADNRHVWGDKYNEYLLQLPEIAAVDRDFRIIFIHRHPLASASSTLNRFAERPWGPRTLCDALTKWVLWNECWLKQRALFSSANRLEISYEEMVGNPRRYAQIICDFLNVRPSSVFCDSFANQLDATRNRPYSISFEEAYRVASSVPRLQEVAGQLGYELRQLNEELNAS
jgi:hypothetical protein